MRTPFRNGPSKAGYLFHLLRCVRLLSRKAKAIFCAILFFQSIISVLDLLGLALIMKIVLGFQSVDSSGTGDFTSSIPLLGDLFARTNDSVLLVGIVGAFLLKGALALALHTLNVRVMQLETIKLTRSITNSIFKNRTTKFRKLNTQDISYAIYNATEMVFRDTLIPFAVIVADTVLLFFIGINLFFNAKVLVIPTVAYFLLIFIVLRKIERERTRNAYKIQLNKEISLRSRVHEVNASLRELYVSSKLAVMTERIISLRSESTKAGATVTLSQLRPKYVYEMALFGGIGVIALISNWSGNEDFIFTYLVLFVVSSSRMIPALMRIQYYLGIFTKSKEQTQRVFEILNKENFETSDEYLGKQVLGQDIVEEFRPKIDALGISFSYDLAGKHPTIDNLYFSILAGETVAIVGRSGAGKSTLVDLILGYLEPGTGSVLISGLDPRKCFETWPGSIAYVPQKVTIYEDTLFANIAVGHSTSRDEATCKEVEGLLEKVEMGDYLRQQKDGLDTLLSESGSSLSGGQMQRIGIARALFSKPQLLVLDESTSSLDSSTEHTVMDFILNMRGQMTLIIIAHRLSTIKSADRIMYIDNGKIHAEGNFDQIRLLIPDFEAQVNFLKS